MMAKLVILGLRLQTLSPQVYSMDITLMLLRLMRFSEMDGTIVVIRQLEMKMDTSGL